MKPETKGTYRQLNPTEKLKDFIDFYFEHNNLTDESKSVTISPDSYFKVIIHRFAPYSF